MTNFIENYNRKDVELRLQLFEPAFPPTCFMSDDLLIDLDVCCLVM